MTIKVLGLGGAYGSGKDEIASRLVLHGWLNYGMSDMLNQSLLVLNPMIPITDDPDWALHPPEEYTWMRYQVFHAQVGYVKAKENPEVRRLLQVLGTDVGREMIDQNVWVDMTRRSMQKSIDLGYKVVVTGIRYENELQMVQAMGGSAWWVHRSGHSMVGTSATHSSETTLNYEDFDDVYYNTSTLKDLHADIDNMVIRGAL